MSCEQEKELEKAIIFTYDYLLNSSDEDKFVSKWNSK